MIIIVYIAGIWNLRYIGLISADIEKSWARHVQTLWDGGKYLLSCCSCESDERDLFNKASQLP